MLGVVTHGLIILRHILAQPSPEHLQPLRWPTLDSIFSTRLGAPQLLAPSCGVTTSTRVANVTQSFKLVLKASVRALVHSEGSSLEQISVVHSTSLGTCELCTDRLRAWRCISSIISSCGGNISPYPGFLSFWSLWVEGFWDTLYLEPPHHRPWVPAMLWSIGISSLRAHRQRIFVAFAWPTRGGRLSKVISPSLTSSSVRHRWVSVTSSGSPFLVYDLDVFGPWLTSSASCVKDQLAPLEMFHSLFLQALLREHRHVSVFSQSHSLLRVSLWSRRAQRSPRAATRSTCQPDTAILPRSGLVKGRSRRAAGCSLNGPCPGNLALLELLLVPRDALAKMRGLHLILKEREIILLIRHRLFIFPCKQMRYQRAFTCYDGSIGGFYWSNLLPWSCPRALNPGGAPRYTILNFVVLIKLLQWICVNWLEKDCVTIDIGRKGAGSGTFAVSFLLFFLQSLQTVLPSFFCAPSLLILIPEYLLPDFIVLQVFLNEPFRLLMLLLTFKAIDEAVKSLKW